MSSKFLKSSFCSMRKPFITGISMSRKTTSGWRTFICSMACAAVSQAAMMRTCGQCRLIFSVSALRLFCSSSTKIAFSIWLGLMVDMQPHFHGRSFRYAIPNDIADQDIVGIAVAVVQVDPFRRDLNAIGSLVGLVQALDLPRPFPSHAVVLDGIADKRRVKRSMDGQFFFALLLVQQAGGHGIFHEGLNDERRHFIVAQQQFLIGFELVAEFVIAAELL